MTRMGKHLYSLTALYVVFYCCEHHHNNQNTCSYTPFLPQTLRMSLLSLPNATQYHKLPFLSLRFVSLFVFHRTKETCTFHKRRPLMWEREECSVSFVLGSMSLSVHMERDGRGKIRTRQEKLNTQQPKQHIGEKTI